MEKVVMAQLLTVAPSHLTILHLRALILCPKKGKEFSLRQELYYIQLPMTFSLVYFLPKEC